MAYNFIGGVYSVKRDYDAASVGGMKHIRLCHGFRRHHDEYRQTREKLQCLYENLSSNNFRRTAVLKKV